MNKYLLQFERASELNGIRYTWW